VNTSHDLQDKALTDIGLSASDASRDSQVEPPAISTSEPSEQEAALSEPQRQALERLNQPNATVTAAAAVADVHRGTFYRWVDTNPTFRALYTTWLRQQQRAGEGDLFASEAACVEVIAEAVRDRRDLSAAKFIVKQALARRQWHYRVHEQRERAQERAYERTQRREDLAREQTLRREERARERAQRREERAREQAQRREDKRTGLEGLL
jgi:hypothetical protein